MEPKARKAIAIMIVIVILTFLVALGLVLLRASRDKAVPEPETELTIINPRSKFGEVGGFRVALPRQAKIGDEIIVVIMAVSKAGFTVPDYDGTVRIKSELLTLPERSKFVIGDSGKHVYKVYAKQAGTDVIEVTDIDNQATGKSESITIKE